MEKSKSFEFHFIHVLFAKYPYINDKIDVILLLKKINQMELGIVLSHSKSDIDFATCYILQHH